MSTDNEADFTGYDRMFGPSPTERVETSDERHVRLANEARASNGMPPFTVSQQEQFLRSIRALERGLRRGR